MESTLSLQYKDYAAKVGTFLGWGRGALFNETAWTDFQTATIDDCVQSGIRQFYFPPMTEGSPTTYDWTFLRPVASLSVISGATQVQLPDDFGGLDGMITLSLTTSQTWWPVRLTNPGRIRAFYADRPNTTGKPESAAIEWIKGTGAIAGQRANLLVWPTTDAAYTMQFTYYVIPDALTGTNPYVYGGPQHVETILESCLAIAEQRMDDAVGVHTQKFQERLLASIGIDRRSKPQDTGYNRDRSDDNRRWLPRDIHSMPPATTYNGVSFD